MFGIFLGATQLTAQDTAIAQGNYPDIAVGPDGKVHLVYGREEKLYYRFYDPTSGQWSPEEFTSVIPGPNSYTLNRADPDILVDSKGQPHVHAWDGYAVRENGKWKNVPLLNPDNTRFRDTELAIDAKDIVYLTKRGGFSGGHLGIQKLIVESDRFVAVTDPDQGLTSEDISNHIYPDIAVSPADDSIHVIQRHGPGGTTAYRRSLDGGKTWDLRNTVSEREPEAPHIVVDSKGRVYATHGGGECFRLEGESWINEGQVLQCAKRDQPELSVDGNDVVYVASFGGRYSTRWNQRWQVERSIKSVTGKRIGFVETAGAEDFAWVVWEEEDGVSNDELATNPASIFLGQIDPQGRFSQVTNRERITSNPTQSLKRFGRFETSLENWKSYRDPFRDVRLEVSVQSPTGRILNLDGFYSGGKTWKFRFRPDVSGTYTWEATCSDGSPGKSGAFEVSEE
ncbi:MAG: DUF5060 domain-containing protein, partial [Verrucomicrobiae bacterium]|nr:DUF5060 domain-containing protein [Verrucomicrobiae bacterium]